ncbi:MAG TPA: ATP-binding protein [Gaiellaceae bacterium]|nr:ATP-binding protein [Gaiellaceae bacterium]
MNPLRSVRARLSLALLLVVAGSLTLVYLVVIPSLQGRLVDSKLQQLKVALKSLQTQALAYRNDQYWYQDQSQTLNARIVFYEVLTDTPRTLKAWQDSNGGQSSLGIEADPFALNASMIPNSFARGPGAFQEGTVTRRGTRYAEVAASYADGSVLLLSAPLEDALDAVGVAKERLLLAGGIVLALVLVVGYLAAWIFARRIRKLEAAAELIASGQFEQPIVDRAQDELGNLARAFERMRLRLAQLDRARREFIANASHELRTPIFSLGGFLELLDDEDIDPATREEFLHTMREQVKRLTKLASELLDLSRLDAGQMEIEREPVALAATARLVADEFAAVAKQTEHTIAIAADESAVALADEQRVVQIVRVLLENAVVHTPPGTSILVRVRREATTVALAVEDSGPGIGAEQAEHVFERFFRGGGRQASGSGLGLAIAVELARIMDGTLELDSSPGRTVFTLTLPQGELPEHEPSGPRLERVRA